MEEIVKNDIIVENQNEVIENKEVPVFNEEEYIKNEKVLCKNIFQKEVEYHVTKKNGSTKVIKYTRKKYISPIMIEDMKNMLAQKIKRKDICTKYSITLPTLKKYIG